MNKKPEKNEPHTQDETQLSPDEIRALRHLLKNYKTGLANSQNGKSEPSSDGFLQYSLGIIIGLLILKFIY